MVISCRLDTTSVSMRASRETRLCWQRLAERRRKSRLAADCAGDGDALAHDSESRYDAAAFLVDLAGLSATRGSSASGCLQRPEYLHAIERTSSRTRTGEVSSRLRRRQSRDSFAHVCRSCNRWRLGVQRRALFALRCNASSGASLVFPSRILVCGGCLVAQEGYLVT